MTQRIVCTIPSEPVIYNIIIQRGILEDQNEMISALDSFGSTFVIITDDKLAENYGNKLCQMLIEHGLTAFIFSFPPGEQSKTRQTKEMLENLMFEKKLGRDTCLIALGGGVVTDLGGYLAATYCRGIPLIMVPTSLMGMVDASIGGKTGVNVRYGKNMLGCIYQPKKVVIDPAVLGSLPPREIGNGAVEMIKHGLIADKTYFDFLENNAAEVLGLKAGYIEQAIIESCFIKKKIVEHDAGEKGKRSLLNFGHTVGHALESLTHYQIAHGEAVAIGILVESHLAVQLGHLDKESFERIRNILIKYGLPLILPSKFSENDILEMMILDKKSLKGLPRFVILEGIGNPGEYELTYCTHVEEELIRNALKWMNNELCCL